MRQFFGQQKNKGPNTHVYLVHKLIQTCSCSYIYTLKCLKARSLFVLMIRLIFHMTRNRYFGDISFKTHVRQTQACSNVKCCFYQLMEDVDQLHQKQTFILPSVPIVLLIFYYYYTDHACFYYSIRTFKRKNENIFIYSSSIKFNVQYST